MQAIVSPTRDRRPTRYFGLASGLGRQRDPVLGAELVVPEHVLGAEELVGAVRTAPRGVLEPVGVMPAGPAVEVAHGGAQAGLVHHRDLLLIRVRRHLAVVGRDVGAVARAVEQITVGLAVGPDARADRGAALQHAHRVAGWGDHVDLDLVLARLEVLLLDLVRQAALARRGKTRRYLHGRGP